MFAESTNRWPIWKIGGRFWLPFGRLSVREKSVADWEKSVADFACCYFSETYFWARFVTILWEFLLL